MTLEEAIALKKKLFPEVKGILCDTIMTDRSRFIWAMRFLYGNGYEVIKRRNKLNDKKREVTQK